MSDKNENETTRVREHKSRDKGAEVKERIEYRRGLSAKEQIKALDIRLGEGIGAQKERAKLNKLIEKE